MTRRLRSTLIVAVGLSGLLVALLFGATHSAPMLHALFPTVRQPLYNRADFATLTVAHLELVFAATGVASVLGISLGIAVTRRQGLAFAPLARTIAAVGQTFPPVAVLALAVPLLGYGAAPTIAALILYATLPIIEAMLAGLQAVSKDARDAAQGLGFSTWGVLWLVELPLAVPILVTGLRNATIINVGTATIGSSVGALSLGSPILEGLSASNPAYVLEGAIVVALLAVSIDRWFDVLAVSFTPRTV